MPSSDDDDAQAAAAQAAAPSSPPPTSFMAASLYSEKLVRMPYSFTAAGYAGQQTVTPVSGGRASVGLPPPIAATTGAFPYNP